MLILDRMVAGLVGAGPGRGMRLGDEVSEWELPGPGSPFPPPRGGSEAAANRAADSLALALEEVGFDVGRAFPMLSTTVDHHGDPIVELGRVSATVAAHLSDVLRRAGEHGIITPARE